jgi:EamA-like transporter family
MTTLALPQPKSLLRLSDLALLGVAVVWGTSYGVAKGALVFYPVLGFLAVRFILTFALLLPTLRHANGQQRRDALRTGLPLGALMLTIFLCETYGVANTQASNAAFLISLCVVFTPFVEWWLLGRRPAQAMFAFAGISLLGGSPAQWRAGRCLGSGRCPDAGRSRGARHLCLPDQQADPPQQRASAGADGSTGRCDWFR